jgi:hypothetical protein
MKTLTDEELESFRRRAHGSDLVAAETQPLLDYIDTLRAEKETLWKNLLAINGWFVEANQRASETRDELRRVEREACELYNLAVSKFPETAERLGLKPKPLPPLLNDTDKN